MANYQLAKSQTFPKYWLSTLNSLEMQLKKQVCPQNSNLYAYAANNPVRYLDPDGKYILRTSIIKENHFYQQDSSRNIAKSDTPVRTDGCYSVANARVINAINGLAKNMDPQCYSLGNIDVDFTISQSEFFDGDLLSSSTSSEMINKFTVFETSTQRIEGKNIADTLEKYASKMSA